MMINWTRSAIRSAIGSLDTVRLGGTQCASEVLPRGNVSASVPVGEVPVLGYRDIVVRSGTSTLVDRLRIKLGLPPEVFGSAVQPVIEAYAEFVQLLPDAESSSQSVADSLFQRALERTNLALDYRRGQILPPNAAPEAIGEQSHRWTYAVFVAALLHDIPKSIAFLRVMMCDRQGSAALWHPLAGSLLAQGATRYRVEFTACATPQSESYAELPLHLFQRGVPVFVQEWLAAHAQLVRELTTLLSGKQADKEGALSALVLRADGVFGRSHARRSLEPVPAEITTATLDGPQRLNDGRVEHEQVAALCADANHSKQQDAMSQTPDVASRFMHWLRQGIVDGSIPINEANAWVHFVAEGMLLVSPRIFKEFVKRFGEDGTSSGLVRAGENRDVVKLIQRQLLRAGWHMQAEQGVNMLTYQAMRGGRAVSRISGVLIRHPERFVNPLPPANPELVLMPRKANTE